MRLLLTRPEKQSAAMKAALEAGGHRVMLAPLLAIEPQTLTPADVAGANVLVLTSANAVAALAACPDALAAARKLPVFAVGDATASAARQAGFSNVTAGPGDAARLLPLLVDAAAKHSSARLVHLAGERVAVDLVAALAARGIAARRVIAYRAVAAKTLPERVRAALAAGGLDAVLLMSPRTAATFAALTAAAGLAEQARTLDHLCLSEAVAAGLGDPPPPKVHIAGSPTQEEMLALVGSLAANSGPSR